MPPTVFDSNGVTFQQPDVLLEGACADIQAAFDNTLNLDPNSDEFVQCTYKGTTAYLADIKQYNFSLSFENISTILLDDFADGSIDITKWSETDPADGVTISETGGRLQFSCNQASPVASVLTNNVISHTNYNFDSGSTRVLRFVPYASGGAHSMLIAFHVNSSSSSSTGSSTISWLPGITIPSKALRIS